MGYNYYLCVLFLGWVSVFVNGCDKDTGELLQSKPNALPTPKFETITQAPTPKKPSDDNKPNLLGDAAKPLTGPGTPATPDFLPTGPNPFPPHPPIPTDDEIDDGEPFGFGPSIPYGVCGNGRVDFKEECDDGNEDNTDGCNILCQYPRCGNGVQEKNEECDDGNTNDGDGCNHRCDFERCGNKCLDFNEQCDDGNLDPGDGCSPCCLFEVCGNKVIDPEEECDDGNTSDGDGCSRHCEREVCGNGKTTPNEQCDDGNVANGDGCSSSCQLESCTNCS